MGDYKRDATDNLITWLDNSGYNDHFENESADTIKEQLMNDWVVQHPAGGELHLTPDGYSLFDIYWDEIAEHFATECCEYCENDDIECTCDICPDCGEKLQLCINDSICERCFYCEELISQCSCKEEN